MIQLLLRLWRLVADVTATGAAAAAAAGRILRAAALECVAQIGERLRILAVHARRHLPATVIVQKTFKNCF